MSALPSAVTGKRSLGVGAIAAIVAGSLALSFGTGYVANKAVFADGSAWLRQGDDAALVSGAGGEPQAEVEGIPEGTVVQDEDGTFHVATESDDGERTTFTAGGSAAEGTTIEGGPDAELLSGPAGAWLVEPATGRVQPVDLAAFEPVGEPVEVGQPLVGQAVDVDGTLWLLDDTGRVRSLEGRELGPPRRLDLGDPDQTALATVGDVAVVADPVSGRLTTSEGDSWAVEGLVGGEVLIAPQQPGPIAALVVVNGSRRSLVGVDLDLGEPLPEVDLGPDPVAAPLPVDHRIFVPTVTDDGPVLRRFDRPDLTEAEAVEVPHGDDLPEPRDGDLGYDAFLEGTRAWANDPRSERAVTVGAGEDSRQVNKLDPSEEGEAGAGEDEEEDTTTDDPPVPDVPAPDPVEPGSGTEPPIPTPPPATTPAPGPAVPVPPPATVPTPSTVPGGDEPVEVRVPDVTGQDPQTACARIQQAGLACTPEAVEDDDRDPDVVFDQSPAAGATVDADTAVTVSFAVRSRVEVPAVEGMTTAQATTALEAAGLVAEPEERTDATPQDTLGVVLPGQEPAAGTEVDSGSTVTITSFTAYTPIAFDPATVIGRPQAEACTPVLEAGFQQCAAQQGDPAPDDASVGVVYAVTPAEAGEYPPDTTVVTPVFHGPRLPRTAAFPSFDGAGADCGPVLAWSDQNGLALTCTSVVAPYDPPQARPYSSIIGQDPAPGTVVTEGQTVAVHLYQPPLRTVIDWARTQVEDPGEIEATHTLRGPEEGPPGDNPGRWVDTGGRMNLFARQVPGSVPVFCWNLTSEGGTLRHFCGTQVPPRYDNPTGWQVGYGGTAIGWAYDDDLGVGARGRFPCGLIKVDDGDPGNVRQLPIGSYYNDAATCGLTPDSGPPDRYEPWDAFWVVP